MPPLSSHSEINLRDYFYILHKRRLIIFLTFVSVLAAGILLTHRAQILYKATTTILIEKENPNIVDFKEVMAFDASSTDYYQTQYQMLESRSLIDGLIEKEKLHRDPYLSGGQKSGLKELIRSLPLLPEWLNPFLNEKSLSALFKKQMLRIDPVRNTRLVNVSILHPDPQRAAQIANSLIDLFIKTNLENRFLISSQARDLLSEQLDELKQKVAVAEKRLQEYKEEKGLMNIPDIREKDKFMQDAKLALVTAQAEEAQLAKRYLPAHPKMINVRSQVEALKERIEEEERKNLSLSRIAIDYSELEREAQSARKIYEALLNRFEEMHSEAKAQASNVMVVDRADPPARPDKPRPFFNMLVFSFLGMLLGVGFAFFFEYLDATVKIPDDVEKGLGLELMGIIPKTNKDKKFPLGGEIFFSNNGKPSQAAEAFRAIRTALLFKLRHVSGCRIIVTTSPNPEEGKSSISLNLSFAFVQNHLKVLLIDADLRKPRLHKQLDVAHGNGLTDVLAGKISREEAVMTNAQNLGFDLLTCGSPSDRPTELLGSDAMKNLIEEARKNYDIVLIDSPPFLAVADVVVLSELADAMLVTAKYHQTEKRHLKDLKRRFGDMQHKVLGVVINQVSVRERDYYYHQYYYYGYGDAPKK